MAAKRGIEAYAHAGKARANNPPVGLVTPETDRDAGARRWAHDPHIDPQLAWAGKAEHASFDVSTVSLHVHERMDPRTIVEAARRRNGAAPGQPSLFAAPAETRRFAAAKRTDIAPRARQRIPRPADRRWTQARKGRARHGQEAFRAREHAYADAIPGVLIGARSTTRMRRRARSGGSLDK